MLKHKKKLIFVIIIVTFGILALIKRNAIRSFCITFYYANSSIPPKEISYEHIPMMFEYVTGRQLPNNIENIKAIFSGGRDHSIRVKFKSNAKDIEMFTSVFRKENEKEPDPIFPPGNNPVYAEIELDYNSSLPIGFASTGFFSPYKKEEKVPWWNPKDIKKGTYIEYAGWGGYIILIDKEKNILYLMAYQM